jgi:hypothetical protein
MLLSHSVSGRRTALVPSCAPGIKHSSRRIVFRKQAEKVEEAAADGQRKTAVAAAASAKTDAAPKGAVSDIDRIKAETKVTIFSAQASRPTLSMGSCWLESSTTLSNAAASMV